MNFIRTKGIIFIIVIMSVLCLAAVGIAVNISMGMLKSHNQIVRDISSKESAAPQNVSKLSASNKLKEQSLYFNGQKIDGAEAYVTPKNEVYIPLDMVLDKTGSKYSFFNADDVLQAVLNNNKILIRLWENSFSLGKNEINLKTVSMATKGHILVPAEMFDYLSGFKIKTYEDKNAVFLNFKADNNSIPDAKIRVLRLASGTAGISDIEGKKVFWDRKGKFLNNEIIEPSPGNSSYMIKSGTRVLLIGSRSTGIPYAVGAGQSAMWSADGSYLYWIDRDKQSSYLYGIKSGITKKLDDSYFGEDDNDISGSTKELFSYAEGTNYRRIMLTGVNNEPDYTYIERKKKTVVEGNADYSPNMKKLLYYSAGKGYYTANPDGTNLTFIGNGDGASWINNNRIFIWSGSEFALEDSNGKNRTPVTDICRKVGQTPGGDVFFTIGNTLYCETNGVEKKIMELPWTCIHVSAESADGPYIMVSDNKEDGVFYITGKTAMKLGDASMLMKSLSAGLIYTDYDKSITSSPDRHYSAVLLSGPDFYSVDIVDNKKSRQSRIVLDYRMENPGEPDEIYSRWLSNDKILVYTHQNGWIIDLKADTRVYEWDEKPGTTIQGIITP